MERIDTKAQKSLDALARRSRGANPAAEASTVRVASEEWQVGELQAGFEDLSAGRTVSHERVSNWLETWGGKREAKAPREKPPGPAGPFNT